MAINLACVNAVLVPVVLVLQHLTQTQHQPPLLPQAQQTWG